MFIGTAQAGDKHAILYTLLENAKRAGLNPREYIVEVIQGLKENKLSEELTPLSIATQDSEKSEIAA